MKKVILSMIICFLLLASAACNKPGGGNDATTESSNVTEAGSTGAETTGASSENSTSAEKETDENVVETFYEYTDISSKTSPVIESNKKNSATATSTPSDSSINTSIIFDGGANIKLSEVKITTADMHESVNCELCGLKDTAFGKAYYICNNSTNQGGFTVELENPIPTGLISGMTITFSASRKITNGSQVRILPHNITNHASFVNDCLAMGGDGIGKTTTVDLGMTSETLAKLTDSDGMIRKFKLYFRDKDNTDIYIKSIDFVVSYENLDYKSLCSVAYIEENCFYKGGALDIIAERIAENFSKIGVAAEITVKATGYTQNTPEKAGKVSYTATVTLEDGTETTIKSLSTSIAPISNAWLERADSPYGAVTSSNEQYKYRFDRAGLIYLENNTFSGADALKAVEYAIIGENDEVTDQSIKWFAPQQLEIDSDSFSMFANAFLDNSNLDAGKAYRFVIRAVTENGNYALHLDIPFIYEPFNTEIEGVLSSAYNFASSNSYMTFEGDENLEARVLEAVKLNAQINADGYKIDVVEMTHGVTKATYLVHIMYNGDISSGRFPTRPSDKLYSYSGEALSFVVTAKFGGVDSAITLISPDDDTRNIVTASSAIVNHMGANLTYLTSAEYPFTKREDCHPNAIVFEWEGDGSESYTLLISESKDMSDPWTFEVNGTAVSVNNLKTGTQYYWQIKSASNSSNVSLFTTAEYPRFIYTENVSNFRDVGGFVTVDGYRVKQGILYRSANLDSVNESDIYMITQILGIKTDLDLRGQSTVSPLGRDTKLLKVSIQWYNGVFAEDQHLAFRRAIAHFAKEENYPMVYHCQIGRDRTGTVTTTILALLGVDEETLIREYMLSFNSVAGNGDNVPGYQMVGNIKSFITGLKNYGDTNATLAEHTEAFLLSIGVTAEEIQAIRDILLEK